VNGKKPPLQSQQRRLSATSVKTLLSSQPAAVYRQPPRNPLADVPRLRDGFGMPLISDVKTRPIRDDGRRAIGFWMLDTRKSPYHPVRIFISYEALADLDPDNIRDLESAFEHFSRFHELITRAASDKFDRGEIEDEMHLGQPVVVLRTDDF
jgi:hypothetical protein